VGAGNALEAQPGDHGDPLANAGLPHRRPAGAGRGPTQEPGEERDGGVRGKRGYARRQRSVT